MDKEEFKKTFKFICKRCRTFSQTPKGYCTNCGAHASRKATNEDYAHFKVMKKSSLDNLPVKQDWSWIGNRETEAKMRRMMDTQLGTLQNLIKNDEEYKALLRRKKKGESVEDLIRKNRSYQEELLKKKKEIADEAIDFTKSGESKRVFEKMTKLIRLDPRIGLAHKVRIDLTKKITSLEIVIEQKEKEYDNLLEQKKKGEFVDDLLNQNRFAVERLLKIKEKFEKLWNEITPDNIPRFD